MRELLVIFCAWMVSFLFNGIEAGLLSIDPVRLRHQVKLGKRGAVRLNRLIERPERLLVTILLVTNFADILGLLLLTRRLIWILGNTGFLISVLVAFPIYLFVLSVLPKALFRRFPFRALAALAGLLEVSATVLWPILETGSVIGRILLPSRIAGRPRLFAAREELKQIAIQREREGSLSATERAMINNVVDFQNVNAHDVMTPLTNVAALTPEASVEEALNLSSSSAFDRLPVVANGEVVGLVNAIDILFDKNRAETLAQYIRRIVTVQENEPAHRVIQRLRAARLGLAAVVDRRKKLIGIVSSEDLIRRLVRA
jgi:CBS domain containing-hemolysin-like protein